MIASIDYALNDIEIIKYLGLSRMEASNFGKKGKPTDADSSKLYIEEMLDMLRKDPEENVELAKRAIKIVAIRGYDIRGYFAQYLSITNGREKSFVQQNPYIRSS